MRFACRENLRTFLGVLLVFTVAVKPTCQSDQVTGENVSTSTGIIGKSVVLQCPCLDRNPEKYLRWQKNGILILKHGRTNENISDYRNRVKLFVAENPGNCSLQINNLTQDDQGTYECYFHTSIDMEHYEISLTVSDGFTGEPVRDYRWYYFAIFPIVLILGFPLVMFYRRKVSRKEASNIEAPVGTGLLEWN